MSDQSETSRRIQELQLLEHNHQALLMQKQTIQLELNEVLNAHEEVSRASGSVYRVLGGIMMQAEKDNVLKDLQEKKKMLEIRVSTIEKQEKIIDDKISSIKKEITATVGKNKQ